MYLVNTVMTEANDGEFRNYDDLPEIGNAKRRSNMFNLEKISKTIVEEVLKKRDDKICIHSLITSRLREQDLDKDDYAYCLHMISLEITKKISSAILEHHTKGYLELEKAVELTLSYHGMLSHNLLEYYKSHVDATYLRPKINSST